MDDSSHDAKALTARSEFRWLIQLSILASILLLTGAAGKELHGTPTFYASLIRELVDHRDLLFIFRGPEAYLLKPPLVLWAGAVASWFFGLCNLSVTLLPRVAAILSVILTYLLVRQVASVRTAWLAGLILLTNSTFIQFSTTLRMDSSLLCGLLLALLGWLALARPWGSAAFFGGLCLGLMAKGPMVLLALPLGLCWSALSGERSWMALRWKWSILLIPALLWYGYVFEQHGNQQVSDLAVDLYRANPNSDDPAWLTYAQEYLFRPALRYWPWLPFILWGFALAVLGAFQLRPPGQDDRPLIWLAVWTVTVFVLCAFKPDRDIRYLYIALPALAGLGAIPLASWLTDRWFDRGFLLVTAASVVAASCAVVGIGVRDTRPQVAAMREILSQQIQATPGFIPVVIGDYPDTPGMPRRQNNQRDWIHFYLGTVPRIVSWSEVKSQALASEPLVFTIRADDYATELKTAGFEPVQVSKEMVMAVRQ